MLASTALIAALAKSKLFPVNQVHASKSVELSQQLIESVVAEVKATDADASSTTGSQTTIVDEETAVQLQSIVKQAIQRLFADDQVKLVDANHAIDYIAYGLSDLVFVYPGSAGRYLGQDLNSWTSSIRNSNGDIVKVVEMETRQGALQAVQGALSGNTKTATVLTSAQALLAMIPNIQVLAATRQPVVFHVSAYSVDSEFVAKSRIDAVLAARNSGAILLSSSTVQEAHDLAIVAHLLARAVQLPVIHFFDGASQVIQSAKLSTYAQLAQLAVPAPGDVYDVAEALLAKYGYKAFEYQGAADAETVLVALNAGSGAVSEAVVRANTKVGLVQVRLYRPWSEAGLFAALPASARSLVVLEQGDGLFAFSGPLFLDLAAAIRFGSLAREARPRLATAQAASFDHIRAAHLPGLLEKASQETFIDLSGEAFGPIKEEVQDVWSAIFWDVTQDGSADAAAHIAHLAHQASPSQALSVHIASDAYRLGGPVVQTRIVKALQPTSSKANFIGLHNITLAKEFDVLSAAAKKATVLVHGPWTHGDEIEAHLTNEFKLALTQLDIQLYALDGNRIAEDNGLHRKSTHLVWEAAYLLLSGESTNAVTQHLVGLYQSESAVATLISDVVDAVAKALVRIELLPPWTILEVNDVALPTQPVDRLVPLSDDQDDISTVVDESEQSSAEVSKWHKAAWQVMFKEAYETQEAVRPDLHEKTFAIKLAVNKRLTPVTYDRNVFHLEFDTTGSDLKYELGDALGVHGHNDYQDVAAFLEWYGLNGDDVVLVDGADGKKEARTIFQLFSQKLDIFGRPSKKFYESLASFATDPKEKEQLLFLVSSEGKEEFKKRVDNTVTYEDLLREFTSAKPPVEALVRMVSDIKPRHYSIASSQKMYNNAVHLLVVAVDWVNASGQVRYGQCTRYLANLPVGSTVTVSIKPSVMRLPPLDSQPVIMAGLGTGMAPFRAFIQERALAKAAGKEVGPMLLYFGSRNRRMEYLYGEELEAYHADGVLTHMGLAFSRDQKQKVYIQHKMMEDAELLHDMLVKKNGHFYLCGPTWPVPDVKDAVVYGLKHFGGIDERTASNLIEEWKEKEKYILEVY